MEETDKQSDIKQQVLTGERALFMAHGIHIQNATFEDGESPLKHSHDVAVDGSSFRWKYPLWYSSGITLRNSSISETARAGIWYTNGVALEHVLIEAPKQFRRCMNVRLADVHFSNAEETLWHCGDVSLQDVYAKGKYFAMNSGNVRATKLTLVGDYPFDGARNVEIRDSRLLSKDAFWNSENVRIYDSYISGEYFAWNSKHVTLENCTVESLQGFCYIEDLVLRNCTLLNTSLAFEYSTVDADVVSKIDSIKNPSGGIIRTPEIGDVIMEADKVDVSKTKIICGGKEYTGKTCAGTCRCA